MRTVWLAFTVLVCSMGAAAQGTFTEFDVPGASYTGPLAINSAGDIVGFYDDTSGEHGFLFSEGVYTTIDYPGQVFSNATGINDRGQVVGATYGNADFSFLYDIATQTYTAINDPGTTQTYVAGINNVGTMAGVIQLSKNGKQREFGFELADGIYRIVLPSGASFSRVYGISNDGTLVVNVQQPGSPPSNYLFKGRVFQSFTVSLPAAIATGLNVAGQIVGTYNETSLGPQNGFIYYHGTARRIQYPGASATVVTGINDLGVVAGYFVDASGFFHGFLWTPPSALQKGH